MPEGHIPAALENMLNPRFNEMAAFDEFMSFGVLPTDSERILDVEALTEFEMDQALEELGLFGFMNRVR